MNNDLQNSVTYFYHRDLMFFYHYIYRYIERKDE